MSRIKFANPAERIMVALDVNELEEAEAVAEDLRGTGVTFKIGNQLGTWVGWRTAVQFAREHDAAIFCDSKFKDIPETVQLSARSMTRHQPDFFNVMADTPRKALEFAVAGIDSAIEDYSLERRPRLLGVTVLTSIKDEDCVSIYGDKAPMKVLQFATYAAKAGLDGVVCSAQEADMLRNNEATKNLILVTPGIRPEWAKTNDQERVMTPSMAIEHGADYLVIGRPITKPPESIGSPRAALQKIIEEIS